MERIGTMELKKNECAHGIKIEQQEDWHGYCGGD